MRLWPRRRIYVDDLPKTHDLRFATLFILIFGLVLGSLYAVGHVLVGDRLPADTTVAGVDIGGMTSGEARTVLQSELVPRIEKPVKATVAGRSFVLDPQESGLTLDIEATVDEALAGGSWDPRHMLNVVSGGGDVSPVIIVNADEMRAALRVIDTSVKRRPTDATVSFGGGQPQVSLAVQGRRLNSMRAAEKLRGALLSRRSSVSLPLAAVEPDVTSSEATRFVSGVADSALSAPIRLRVTDQVVRLLPRVFGPALRAKAVDGGLRLDVDAAALGARSRGVIDSLPNQPVDARILFKGDRTVIRPSQAGVEFSKAQWATAVLKAVTRNAEKRNAAVRTSPTQPGFTTQQARMLAITTPVVSRVVRYEEISGDGTVAARQLHRLLLPPGETVSLRDRVSVRRYLRTSTLSASAIYEAAFRAGLTVVERTPSPVYVSSSTPGLDATLSVPGSDLVIRNDTPYGVLVRAYAAPLGGGIGDLHVELWSSPYLDVTVTSSQRYDVVEPAVIELEGPDCTPRQGAAGFQIDVSRTLSRGDGPGRVEATHTRYQSLPEIRCV
ncbi:MAG: peptidoglycan binding domain-containing protein [Nocardioidaceae bacterium]